MKMKNSVKSVKSVRDYFSLLLILALTGSAGCASYVIPSPSGFAPATALPVKGNFGFKLNDMTVGDYHVAIKRGSTRDDGAGTDLVTERGKQQAYNFVIRLRDAVVFTGGCFITAEETAVNAPAGIKITAKESAELECEMLPQGRGSQSWKLLLTGAPDRPLNGTLSGTANYTIEGIGTAFGSTKHGPTGGYYIKQNDQTVATVQVVSKRQVLFAPGAQSDALLAAAVAMLLVDESARDLD